jgi:hypothetical protein
MDDDPTKMGNQPALTTSSGTVWLVTGAITAVISIVLLFSLQQVNSSGIAIAGIVVIALLYVAMVEVRLLVRGLRLRLILLAIGFGLLTAVALGAVLVIAASQIV